MNTPETTESPAPAGTELGEDWNPGDPAHEMRVALAETLPALGVAGLTRLMDRLKPVVASLVRDAEQRGRDETEEERADLERQNCDLMRSITVEQARHRGELADAEQRGAEADAEALTNMQRMLKEAGERLAAVQAERDDLEVRLESAQEHVTDLAAKAHVAEAKVRAVALIHVWTNEERKGFLFADDVREALGLPR